MIHSVRRVAVLIVLCLTMLAVMACNLQAQQGVMVVQLTAQTSPTVTPSETIPPNTPLATLTPSRTLLPPPTFEPPTATVAPSATPTVTPTATLDLSVSIPGLHGAETPTPTTTPGCRPRQDWSLTYTVQINDNLTRIAQRYGTTVDDLAAGNCLRDPNVVIIGQQLRVPGSAQPAEPTYDCTWEVLTPTDGSFNVSGDGQLTFNWRGPRAERNLIRVHRPDGSIYERVVDLRQNETIDLYEALPAAGQYTWYVYPLDFYFRQIPCHEGGPWTFTKPQAATATPTMTPFPTGGLP